MPVNAEELKFIEAFRTSTAMVKAGATILHEQKPNGKLFTLYSGWAFRYKTLRRLRQLGLHDIQDGKLRLLNTRALERIADYYDSPPLQVPLL